MVWIKVEKFQSLPYLNFKFLALLLFESELKFKIVGLDLIEVQIEVRNH